MQKEIVTEVKVGDEVSARVNRPFNGNDITVHGVVYEIDHLNACFGVNLKPSGQMTFYFEDIGVCVWIKNTESFEEHILTCPACQDLKHCNEGFRLYNKDAQKEEVKMTGGTVPDDLIHNQVEILKKEGAAVTKQYIEHKNGCEMCKEDKWCIEGGRLIELSNDIKEQLLKKIRTPKQEGFKAVGVTIEEALKNTKTKILTGQGVMEQTKEGGQRESSKGRGRFDLFPYEAMEALAIWFELGAEKYGDRNWEDGLSVKDSINRMIRHAIKAGNGWTDEDHLAAVMWNAACALTMMKRRPDCDDHTWRAE